MTQDEIIEMARQAGWSYMEVDMDKQRLEAFAKLVAEKRVEGMVVMTPDEFKSVWDKAQAEEREACAKVADSHMDGTPEWNSAANNIAASIRARGQA